MASNLGLYCLPMPHLKEFGINELTIPSDKEQSVVYSCLVEDLSK